MFKIICEPSYRLILENLLSCTDCKHHRYASHSAHQTMLLWPAVQLAAITHAHLAALSLSRNLAVPVKV
jgi:hypothetical protein